MRDQSQEDPREAQAAQWELNYVALEGNICLLYTSEADFQESYNVGSFAIGKDTMKLGELIAALKQTYCGAIGAEYMLSLIHI